jgi:hypothetical protein
MPCIADQLLLPPIAPMLLMMCSFAVVGYGMCAVLHMVRLSFYVPNKFSSFCVKAGKTALTRIVH